MLSEEVLDTSRKRVTPAGGEGALGQWRAPERQHRLDAVPGSGDNLTGCRARGITRPPRGVYGRAFQLRDVWEGLWGHAAAANRTRESRPSGMRGGLTETWAMVELGTRRTHRKGTCRKLSTYRCARRISTRQPLQSWWRALCQGPPRLPSAPAWGQRRATAGATCVPSRD